VSREKRRCTGSAQSQASLAGIEALAEQAQRAEGQFLGLRCRRLRQPALEWQGGKAFEAAAAEQGGQRRQVKAARDLVDGILGPEQPGTTM
jgi:hypothetical protein